MKTIYYGEIQEIFGYGISCLAETEQECYSILKKTYEDWKDIKVDKETFDEVLEYWGGGVSLITIGKAYHDAFKS